MTTASIHILLHNLRLTKQNFPSLILKYYEYIGFMCIILNFCKVTNLGPPHSNCRAVDVSTTPSDVYTVPVCMESCKADYVVKKCGCRDYRYPGEFRLDSSLKK